MLRCKKGNWERKGSDEVFCGREGAAEEQEVNKLRSFREEEQDGQQTDKCNNKSLQPSDQSVCCS